MFRFSLLFISSIVITASHSAVASAVSESVLVAAHSPSNAAEDAPKVIRVGGDYLVGTVDRTPQERFVVEFKAVHPTGHFDVLKLETDHVHVGIKPGMTVRLSAEIDSSTGPVAEASQVVIFFHGPSGRVPVWLLSSRVKQRDLGAIRYLEMHNPATDFVVM